MGAFREDVRFAARMLARNKLVTAAAAGALALGMGMNTAIYSGVSGILWNTMPYPEPERLVSVWGVNPQRGFNQTNVSWRDAEDWRTARSIESLAQFRFARGAMRGESEAESVEMVEATPEIFDVLKERPAIGRAFAAADRPPGEHRVAVVTESLWKRLFQADPGAIGRELRIDGRGYTVIGVMPPGFQFLYRPAEVIIPLRLTPQQIAERGNRGLRAIARLAPGATAERANAEIASISRRLESEAPESNRGWNARIAPLDEDVIPRGARTALNTLFGAVIGVLVMACANVASLLLARGTTRRRELAIRASLGAGRGRIVRLLLTESLLLALIGGVLGACFAAWAIPFLRSLAPPGFPRIEFMRLNPETLAYTFALCLVSGLIAGVAPAWRFSRGELARSLTEGGRGGAFSRQRTLQVLVAVEMALATVLLTVTGVLVRSVMSQVAADPGFDRTHLVAASVALPPALYEEPHQIADFYTNTVETLQRDPRIAAAAASQTIPLGGSNSWSPVTIEGRSTPDNQRDLVGYMNVTPGYFATFGIPLLDGRDFGAADRAKAPEVAIVNQTTARRYWPKDASPVGRRLRFGSGADSPWRTVVGVVRDVRHQNAILPPRPEVYVPAAQSPSRQMMLVARTHGDPAQAAPALRRAVASVDANLPAGQVETVEQIVDRRYAGPRVTAQILGFLSLLALLLAGIGIYGVLSFLTSQRSREIGIRVALGAVRGDVMRLVLRRGSLLAGVGLVVGIAGAAAVTPLVRSIMSGIEPHDLGSFSAAAGALLTVAVIGCAVPALRALRVDPVKVLREE